jgi:hypothetical protein
MTTNKTSKLVLARAMEAYGDRDQRSYIPASEIVAEWRAGTVALSIKRSAVDGKDPRPEAVAATTLDADERQALIAYLSALPTED